MKCTQNSFHNLASYGCYGGHCCFAQHSNENRKTGFFLNFWDYYKPKTNPIAKGPKVYFISRNSKCPGYPSILNKSGRYPGIWPYLKLAAWMSETAVRRYCSLIKSQPSNWWWCCLDLWLHNIISMDLHLMNETTGREGRSRQFPGQMDPGKQGRGSIAKT